MMLRSDNHAKQVKRLQKTVKELDLDLKAIVEEHDRYRLQGPDDKIMNWFHSLPIETLVESLDREYHKPRTKYSLHDMKHKFALRKLHEKKSKELEQKKTELNLAKINHVLAQIERIQNDPGSDPSGNQGRKRTSRQKVGRSKS
jgi:hypothetical protein